MRWSSYDRNSDHAEGLLCVKGAACKYDHPHDPEPDLEALYGSGYFVDDVKGGTLDRSMVIAARKLEMDFFRQMGVYLKMPRSSLPAGAETITTKWVDTNKGTSEQPNYRSRLVGREIKTDDRPDLSTTGVPQRHTQPLC